MNGNQKKSGMQSRKRRDIIFYSLLMAFPVLQFLIFYLAVNVNSFTLAFRVYDKSVGEFSWAGFSNFQAIFNKFELDPTFLHALGNSLTLLAWQLIVGVPLALLFSYYIYKKMYASEFFRVILFLPSILSAVVMVTLYKYSMDIFLPGVVNEVFSTDAQPFLSDPDLQFGLLVFYTIWLSFGSSTLLYSGTMSGIDVSIVEAAELDGANPLQEFAYITVPMIYSTLVVFVVVAIAGVFTNQMNLYSFFVDKAEYSVYTIGYYLYKNTAHATGEGDYPQLAAFGLLGSFIVIPLTLVLRWVLGKFDPMEQKEARR